jgi:hypothetical protein
MARTGVAEVCSLHTNARHPRCLLPGSCGCDRVGHASGPGHAQSVFRTVRLPRSGRAWREQQSENVKNVSRRQPTTTGKPESAAQTGRAAVSCNVPRPSPWEHRAKIVDMHGGPMPSGTRPHSFCPAWRPAYTCGNGYGLKRDLRLFSSRSVAPTRAGGALTARRLQPSRPIPARAEGGL